MIDWWPHWIRPWWLFALPVASYLLWQLYRRQQRLGSWHNILPQAFQPVLLSAGNSHSKQRRWWLLGVAWLLTTLALMGPSWERIKQPDIKPDAPLVIALELSHDMLASDALPTRLDQAKRKIIDLLEARPNAQTALIAYAGTSHVVVPLSNDHATVRNLLDALHPDIMPVVGHRADRAVKRAQKLLEDAGYPDGDILLIGSNLSAKERAGIAKVLGRKATQLSLLALGTTQGAPIQSADGTYLKDAQGAIRLARLDLSQWQALAKESGARFSRARVDGNDLQQLKLTPEHFSTDQQSGQTRTLADWADQGHWLVLLVLLLAACAGRRGWLFSLLLLISLPQSGWSMSFSDLWLRPDQQGMRLLQQGHAEQAARTFTDPSWQGQALYQAGDYEQAAKRFNQQNSASAHYNRGNALARSGELEAALDAYQQALELDPQFEYAQANKALIEELLRQQQDADKNSSEDDAENNEAAPQDNPTASTGQHSEQSTDPQDSAEDNQAKPEQADNNATAEQGSEPQASTSEDTGEPSELEASTFDDENQQALEQWLRQIPDQPGDLLRRKFLYEQQQRREQQP